MNALLCAFSFFLCMCCFFSCFLYSSVSLIHTQTHNFMNSSLQYVALCVWQRSQKQTRFVTRLIFMWRCDDLMLHVGCTTAPCTCVSPSSAMIFAKCGLSLQRHPSRHMLEQTNGSGSPNENLICNFKMKWRETHISNTNGLVAHLHETLAILFFFIINQWFYSVS